MNNIAFFIGGLCVTWHGIIMALAVLAAVLSAVMLRRLQRLPLLPVLASCAVGCVLVPLLSRFVYWYCSYEQYKSLWAALTTPSAGGQSMIGAVAGALLSVPIARKLTLATDPEMTLGELFDCILPSGVIGVAVGRLAGLFDSADKGKAIVTNEAFQKLPFSVPVSDVYTGETSYRLAVFMFEAAAALGIYIVSMLIFRKVYCAEHSCYRGSDPALFTLSLYMASQCVFDSMKYDALFLRSNGFVCLMQIFGLMILLTCGVIAAVRAVRRGDFRQGAKNPVIIAVGSVLLLAQAGYMEYFVQRHGNLWFGCYAVMFVGLVGISAVTLMLLKSPEEY